MGIESFLYQDSVEAVTLFDLAVNALINNDDSEALVGHLLGAWWQLVDEDEIPIYELPRERYTAYQRVYAAACYGRKPREEDEIWEPDFPTNTPLPKKFVCLVAKIQGQKDKHFSEAMREYALEYEAAKAAAAP